MQFETAYPDGYEEVLTGQLIDAGVAVEVDAENPGVMQWFLGTILPYVLIFGVFIFILMQMQGGGNRVMAFGRSKAKQVTRDQPKVTFKDVAGIDEAVEELQEIKEFLARAPEVPRLGAKIPKGVLLVGPPGTGKTLLARAVAGEAGVPFFSISGSDFVEMFVGVGASPGARPVRAGQDPRPVHRLHRRARRGGPPPRRRAWAVATTSGSRP